MRHFIASSLIIVAMGVLTAGQIVTDRNRLDALQRYRAGQQALRAERFDEAEREFQSAVKLDPLLDLGHYGLGQVYMATKRYARAVAAYQNCRAAFVKYAAEALQNTTKNDQRIDDRIQALKDAKHGYETNRGTTLNTTATIMQLDMQISALEHQRHRHADRPQEVPSWISLALGSAYFRTDAMADAEREYQAAIAVDPKLGEAHNNLAVVYLLTGRYAEADGAIQAAEKAGFRVSPQLKEDLKKARARP